MTNIGHTYFDKNVDTELYLPSFMTAYSFTLFSEIGIQVEGVHFLIFFNLYAHHVNARINIQDYK